MDEKVPMTQEAYLLVSVILFVIGFVGFFSNLTVIIMMYRDQKLRTPLNYILFNLIVSDFTVSILGNPLTLLSAIANEWIFGSAMCVAYGFFMALLGITSISTLTVLALERYLMITHPLNRASLSRKAAFYTVVAVWTYSAVVTVPPLFGWGEYGPEAANLSCSVNWESRGTNSRSYIMYMFVLGFFLPIIVIIFSYINIITTIRTRSVAMGGVSKAESRVTWMIAVMILAFLVAWTPYAIFALIIAYLDVNISPAIATVPAIFAKTSICYNPVIYVGLNTQFKQSWQKLFGFKSTSEVSTEGVTTALSAVSPRRVKIECDDDSNGRTRYAKIFIFQKIIKCESKM